jgi:hypothetical protein
VWAKIKKYQEKTTEIVKNTTTVEKRGKRTKTTPNDWRCAKHAPRNGDTKKSKKTALKLKLKQERLNEKGTRKQKKEKKERMLSIPRNVVVVGMHAGSAGTTTQRSVALDCYKNMALLQ